MNKTKKILLIVFVIISVIVSGVAIFGYFWISDWSKISSNDEMKFNAQNINETEKLSPNFYKVWDKLFPDSRNISMTKQSREEFFHGIGLQKGWKNCMCDEIGYNSWNNHNFEWKYNQKELLQTAGYRRFGFGLNKYSSPDKCFDFWINHDFYFKTEQRYFNGLNEFANILYQRDIHNLSDNEIIEMITYRLMETYPPNNNKRFDEKKNKLLRKRNKATI